MLFDGSHSLPCQVDLPLVPSNGLYLNRVIFDNYNRKFCSGPQASHTPLTFDSPDVRKRQDKYKWQRIITHIVAEEKTTNPPPFFDWLRVMQV